MKSGAFNISCLFTSAQNQVRTREGYTVSAEGEVKDSQNQISDKHLLIHWVLPQAAMWRMHVSTWGFVLKETL